VATDDVLAYKAWRSNSDMIRDVCKLWLAPDDENVLDATYGSGGWWNWAPKEDRSELLGAEYNFWDNDRDPHSPAWWNHDFRAFPRNWYNEFDIVCYDPPYKLNGRPSPADVRYGVGEMQTVRERLMLIEQGYFGCRQVTKPGGLMWVKVMDQVVSGRVVWQTQMVHGWAKDMSDKVIDRFDLIRTPRPQRGDQVHARRNGSTLLIVEKHR
jgi:hypothetical protein